MKWRIYYGDGSTFDSDNGPPEDAPKTNVQVIRQRRNPGETEGWSYVHSADNYIWHDGQWWAANDSGFWQVMFEPGSKIVIFGQSIANDVYNAITVRAVEEGYEEE